MKCQLEWLKKQLDIIFFVKGRNIKNINISIAKEDFSKFFLKFDKEDLSTHIEKLITNMQKKIVFEIKILNTSIHFTIENVIFSACGFRRKQNYSLIEFFSKARINNKRIVKEIKNKYTEKNKYIINRVEIRNENEIDDELIEWICSSYNLIKNFRKCIDEERND